MRCYLIVAIREWDVSGVSVSEITEMLAEENSGMCVRIFSQPGARIP